MCIVTQHAIQRGIDRFGFKTPEAAERGIREAFDRSAFVGDWYEASKRAKQRLFYDSVDRRVLVADAKQDVVITAWSPDVAHIAHELVEDVIKIHVARARKIDRERVKYEKFVGERRPQLEIERAAIDDEIRSLQDKRSAIDNEMAEIERQMCDYDARKKAVVKSLSNVLPV